MNSSNHRDIGRISAAGRYWRWLRNSSLLAMALLILGCGGGGGSSGGSAVVETPSRAINVNNAEAVTKLALEMIDVSDVLVTSWGLGSGINETRCESGSGIGTVTDCVIGGSTFNGSITSSTEATTRVVVPGQTQPRDMPAELRLAINSLRWQSVNNRATYTINGNVLVVYKYATFPNGVGTATITGSITLTDNATSIRYQYRSMIQRYRLRDNTEQGGYLFEHTDHKGAVVYLDETLQYLLTTGANSLDLLAAGIEPILALAGVESTLSLNRDGDNYLINLDTDKDGIYDTFAAMPLSDLGKGHGSSGSVPVVSVTRLGLPLAIGKKVAVGLQSKATDADHNFYTFSWAITSAPAGATGDNAATVGALSARTSDVRFIGRVAGTYIITVTATEVGTATPLSSSAQISLYVMMDAPAVDAPGLNGATGAVGTPVSFPVQLQNSEGILTTTLIAAPAGMTLTGNAADGYQLLWNPQPQFFPGTVETVSIQISNADHATVQTFDVSVDDANARLPLVTPGISVNTYPTGATIANVDDDAAGELLMAGNGPVFFGLNLDGSSPTVAMANPYMIDADADGLMAVKPLRRGGIVSAYAVASTRGVYVVEASDYRVSASRGLQFNLTPLTAKRRFAVADVNGDGTDEILALTKTAHITLADQLFVLNQDLTTLVSTGLRDLGQEFLVGNVDTDSGLEIVCGKGVIFDAATLAVEVDAGTLFGNHNYVLADVDADGRQEIVEVTLGEILVFDVDGSARTAIPFGLDAENLNLFGLNADGDASEELVIGARNNVIHVYSINKDALTANLDRSIGNAALNSTVTEVARGDVDGDTTDELVFVSHNGGGPQINVASLAGGVLIDGTAQTLATGNFSAALPFDVAADSNFFTASLLRNGAAVEGVLSINAAGEPAVLALDIAANTAISVLPSIFAATADIDGNTEQDLLASATLRGDSNLSVLAQLTNVSSWQLPIVAGTPAPIAPIQADGTGDLEAVYIERTGFFGEEALSLVIHEVGGSELARLTLQTSGPVVDEPLAIRTANLDGDTDPDIVLLNSDSLQTFEYIGGSLEQRARVASFSTFATFATATVLTIGDINGDGDDEIALFLRSSQNNIRTYDGDLVLLAQNTIPAPAAPASALAFYAGTDARPVLLAGSQNQVMAFDAQNLVRLWTSPLLLGDINTIHVQTLDGGDQLRIGADSAIYRSQR